MGQTVTISQLRKANEIANNDLLAVWDSSDSITKKINVEEYKSITQNNIPITQINDISNISDNVIIQKEGKIQNTSFNSLLNNIDTSSFEEQVYSEIEDYIETEQPEFKVDTEPIYEKGTLLPYSADLNNYFENKIGTYYGVAQTPYLNSPFLLTSSRPNFKMTVEEMGQDWHRQTIPLFVKDDVYTYCYRDKCLRPTSEYSYQLTQDNVFDSSKQYYYLQSQVNSQSNMRQPGDYYFNNFDMSIISFNDYENDGAVNGSLYKQGNLFNLSMDQFYQLYSTGKPSQHFKVFISQNGDGILGFVSNLQYVSETGASRKLIIYIKLQTYADSISSGSPYFQQIDLELYGYNNSPLKQCSYYVLRGHEPVEGSNVQLSENSPLAIYLMRAEDLELFNIYEGDNETTIVFESRDLSLFTKIPDNMETSDFIKYRAGMFKMKPYQKGTNFPIGLDVSMLYEQISISSETQTELQISPWIYYIINP